MFCVLCILNKLTFNAKCIFWAQNELKFVAFAVAFLGHKIYKLYAALIVA